MKKRIFFLLKILLISVLFSCSSDRVNHSDYIPTDACAVLSINTEAIFSDAFFDLIAHNDLTNDIAKGPLSDLIKDPANAGIQRLSKYYFFSVGSSFLEGKIGTVLPLNDNELLATYIEQHFPSVEVLTDQGFLVAELSSEHTLVWDENAAIYFYSPFGGDLISEMETLFKQTESTSLEHKDSSFHYALRNSSHLSLWVSNDDFLAFLDDGVKMLRDYSFFESIDIKKEDLTGAKSVFLANFNEGRIEVQQKQYLNPTQMAVYKGFDKANNIKNLTGVVQQAYPLALFTTSLKSEGLLEMLKFYRVDKAWDAALMNSPIKFKMGQLAQFFKGDVLAALNGVDTVKKTIKTVDMDDEGNDLVITQEVSEPVQQINLAMSLKDADNFQGILKLISGDLPKVNGFSSLNGTLFFSVVDKKFLLTTTPQGVEEMKTMSSKLSPELDTLVGNNRTAAYIDFNALFEVFKHESPLFLQRFNNLDHLVFSEQGVYDVGVVEGKMVIYFKNNDNGLISTIKLISEAGTLVQPVIEWMM